MIKRGRRCEWKSHEPIPVSQEEEGTPERGSKLGRRRGCERTNERSDIKCTLKM